MGTMVDARLTMADAARQWPAPILFAAFIFSLIVSYTGTAVLVYSYHTILVHITPSISQVIRASCSGRRWFIFHVGGGGGPVFFFLHRDELAVKECEH